VIIDELGVVTVLPLFPYSRQPDVPYVRADTPLANAPAMLFKDSFTMSSGPATPVTSSYPNSENGTPTQPKRPIENATASASMTDRSDPIGALGASTSTRYFNIVADSRVRD
jgi:hypothetical protein